MSRSFYGRSLTAALAVAILLIGLGAQPPQAAETSNRSAPKLEPIDVNRATVDELTRIPGIGKVTAERIVAFREEHGPFTRVEDLMKVKGIGEKSFQKLRKHLRVSSGR